MRRLLTRFQANALPPTVALWVAWVVFTLTSVGGSAIASSVMLDRAPRAAPLLCLIGVVVAGTFYRLLRRIEAPAEPEPRRVGTLHGIVLIAATLVGIAPAFVYNMARPEYLIYAPWLQLGFANVQGVLPFGAILLVTWLVPKLRTPQHARLQWAASVVVFGVHAAWASTSAVGLGFLLNVGAFESLRQDLSSRTHMTKLSSVGLYRVDRAGNTLDICGRGPYFVIEMCDYVPSQDSCFAGSGGAGFYYTPPGTPDSCFNIGGDGALPGGWRWYVAD